MKNYLFSLFMAFALFSINTVASDYTGWAVPSQVEIVQNGISITGDFGNVNDCKNSNEVFYGNADTDYKLVASMAMAAIAAQKEMQFYVDGCFDVTFHGKNINRARNGAGIFFK